MNAPPPLPGPVRSDTDLRATVPFDFIRYAGCWEDADILCEALQPAPGKRMLSIASGGDNAFALLAEGAEVVAADLNPSQLACADLKLAAIRALDPEPLLGFLGVRPATDRLDTYRRLRAGLQPRSRDFWDAHGPTIAEGLIHGGKFERYFRLFRSRVLPLVHSRRTVAELLAPKPLDARRSFYERRWNNLRWRALFRVFFSRFVMGRMGRDPEFFRFVEGSVADRILARARHALTELPTHDNPYLEYILTGGFSRALPRYLRPDKLDAIRRYADRLSLFEGPIQDAAIDRGGRFDGFNLSDIFEYLDAGTCAAIYTALLETARPGARFAYWNMLVPRRRPDALAARVTPMPELSERLFRRDKAFFYSAFVVEEA